MEQKIKDLFAGDIYRRIEEVIKVDQTDEQVIREEIGEYIVTNTIRDHFREILDQYNETPNKPHEGIGIWVSGFFGSGKSSFAKMLGLALLTGGIWAQIDMVWDETDVKAPFRISKLTPIQLATFDLEEYRQGRAQFSTDEWLDFILRSMGYEPSVMERRTKLLFLARLSRSC